MIVIPGLDEIKVICDQIGKAEGYGEKDAIPTDARNPGDLMLGSRFGLTVLHQGRSYTGMINGVTIYPKADRNTDITDLGDGFAALWREIQSIYRGTSIFYHADMTIQEVADLWTKTDPSFWAKNVADGLNVSVNTKFSALNIQTV